MIEVVHLTAHLGGGVGKALSELVSATHAAQAPVRHVFVCLERPEKSQFLERIERHGGEVLVEPEPSELVDRLAKADIVQLEWWNHPATIAALCNLPPLPMSLIVWCHVSGLCNPIIPSGLVDASRRFILTSECSRVVETVSIASAKDPKKVTVISSAGGLDRLPQPARRLISQANIPLAVGYLGSLNFSKLHPNFTSWAASVQLPNFRVRLIGDPVNNMVLKEQAAALGRTKLFEFSGYTNDIATALASIDVMAYLLNPRHYGTAENALVEAMAMGVVPVVLNNPAERFIVEDGVTGIVISSGYQLNDVLNRLAGDPEKFNAMSDRASREVRRRFSSERMETDFRKKYLSLVAEPKHPIDFKKIFGNTPADWFLSCQSESMLYGMDGRLNIKPESPIPHDQFEMSKGSVFQFSRYFPDDPRLGAWTRAVEAYRC